MIQSKPWLSILMPVYNVEAYLRQCVESVLLQSDADVELLLLDDVSTDGSLALMQQLASNHPGRLKLLQHSRNQGLSAARNSLLAQATGQYVWFVDSDDLLMPGAIAAIKQAIDSHDPDLLLIDYRYVRERMRLHHWLRGEGHRKTFFGPKVVDHDQTSLIRRLLQMRQLHAWSKIARRRIWLEALFPVGRFFEDIPTIPKLVAATRRYCHIARPLIGYRQRSGSILSGYNATKMSHLLTSVLELHQGVSALQCNQDGGCNRELDYFCLRALASTARRINQLPEAESASLHWQYQLGFAQLFPQGVDAVLSQWRNPSWWLRAMRVRAQLKSAGFSLNREVANDG